MSDTKSKRTVVEDGTELRGTLTSSCPIVVLGRVEGDVTGPSIEVADTGVLAGRAKVTTLRSRGELAGEFDAETVDLSGKVRDGTVIRARALEVSLDSANGSGSPLTLTFGACALQIGDEPQKDRAVADAIAAAKPVKASEEAPTAARDDLSDAPAEPPASKRGRRDEESALTSSEAATDGA